MNHPSQTGTLILPDYLIDEPGAAVRCAWGIRLLGRIITDVAPHDDLMARYPNDHCWYARNQVLSPGFVDAHTHLEALLAHGMPRPQDVTEETFLSDFWWTHFVDRLDQKMVAAATESACYYYLHSGVTTVASSLEAPRALPGILSVLAEILEERGLRTLLAYAAGERNGPAAGKNGLVENQTLLEACVNGKYSPRIQGAVVIDGTNEQEQSFCVEAQRMAQDTGALYHVHTRRSEQHLRRDGRSSRVYTPITESHFAVEKPSLLTLADGDRVGLGSDGALFDFFRVMRSAQRQSRYGDNDHLLPAGQIWRLATAGGASALGLEKVGRLAPDWQADLQLIDTIFPGPITTENLYDQLLRYGSSSHVKSVLIAGEVRVSGGVVLEVNAAAVRAQAQAAARRLWGI